MKLGILFRKSIFINILLIPTILFCTADILSTNPMGRSIKIRMYLEGALVNTQEVAPNGRRLMRDNLRLSPFDGKNYIPLKDPYSSTISMVDLSIINKHVGVGSAAVLCTISDPTRVFAVTGQNAIVDWVFVEIRSSTDNKQVIATRSGLLQRDGDVVDVDGVSDLLFPDLSASQFYVVVRHRNHLGVMSSLVDGSSLIDFSNPSTPVFDFGTTIYPNVDFSGLSRKNIQPGLAVLWAGNFNGDLEIKFDPPNDDHNVLIMENTAYAHNGIFNSGALGYYQSDFDLNSKAKYDNPDDDKNLLLAQMVFYELNYKYLFNFSFFLEQVPKRN